MSRRAVGMLEERMMDPEREPTREFRPGAARTLSAMRGDQWPFPPATEGGFLEWFPESPGAPTDDAG